MSALDTVIRKLEGELDERKSAYEAILSHSEQEGREPNESESATMTELTVRMKQIGDQLKGYDETDKVIGDFAVRARELDTSIATRRAAPDGVEYRSAGAYMLDAYNAHLGDEKARSRLELYFRAAAHQKTSDNLGVVPDPIVGDVVNFIDAARPLVTAIGVKDLPSATFYRPLVTQNPTVAVQGSAGAAADEKAELVSQKMTITRLTATAVTYGGYVNVSRQNIDFSDPAIMDIVIEGLAAQYAIATEASVGTKLDASTGTPVGYGASPTAATITAAVWAVAATVYTAVKGQGQLILALAPDRLAVFGPLFPPINPQNGQSQGLFAGNFNQGVVGGVAGIQVLMSAGLASGKAFLFSTSAIDLFEQRVGTLSVVEPSVLGVQVGYAGYFTSLILSNNGIIELTAT
jgi:HK97 family phage major capsid protein